MTTASTDGLDHYRDHAIGRVAAPIDTIAVGVGTRAESTADASLEQEVYRDTAPVVTFVDGDDPGETTAVLPVTGGDDVAGGTRITEVNAIAAGVSQPVLRMVWSGVTLDDGFTENVTIPIDIDQL